MEKGGGRCRMHGETGEGWRRRSCFFHFPSSFPPYIGEVKDGREGEEGKEGREEGKKGKEEGEEVGIVEGDIREEEGDFHGDTEMLDESAEMTCQKEEVNCGTCKGWKNKSSEFILQIHFFP